jgi:hypothetical protein
MATSDPTPTDSTKSDSLLRESLEHLAKNLPGIIGVVYIAGFIVVTAHHSLYGIHSFDLLRSRIVAAGLIFLLCILPLIGLNSFRRLAPKHRFYVSVLTILCLVLAGIEFPYARVFTYWLEAMILLAFFLSFAFKPTFIFEDLMLIAVPFLLLAMLFGFFVYGVLFGRIQPVLIHFSHPTAFGKDDCPAFLVDETDSGYYLVHKEDDRKASFIPREAVGSIDF